MISKHEVDRDEWDQGFVRQVVRPFAADDDESELADTSASSAARTAAPRIIIQEPSGIGGISHTGIATVRAEQGLLRRRLPAHTGIRAGSGRSGAPGLAPAGP